jgi:FkbM family methyltransferase
MLKLRSRLWSWWLLGPFLFLALPVIGVWEPAAVQKLIGRAPHCGWYTALELPFRASQRARALRAIDGSLRLLATDAKAGLQQFATPQRPFWLKRGGRTNGRQLLGYLLVHIAEETPPGTLRRGDIVLDCGAHVGTYTSRALELGAAKVVAIEPDPLNLECLRRNFGAEIAAGRVVVYPKGVWSSETTLEFRESDDNSGMNSAVLPRDGAVIRIPVTTIDRLVRELNLARVDFIKMDIEGAEREALKGAAATLRSFHPRLALDSNHRSDDMQVFPTLLPGYRVRAAGCRACDEDVHLLTPDVTYWE